MKNVLDRNLEALKTYHPQLFKSLQPFIEAQESSAQDYLQILTDDQMHPSNLIHWRQSPEWIGQLHQGDAQLEAESILLALQNQAVQLVIILGQGLGYLLHELLNLQRNDIHGHLIVEKNPLIFLRALETFNFTEALRQTERFYWLVGRPESHLESELSAFLSEFNTVSRSIKILACPRILDLESSYYLPLAKNLIGLRDQVTLWTGTSVDDSFRGLQNLLRNLPRLLSNPGIQGLKNRYQGQTCISVAAGPALNEAWDILKELQGKVCIIACDTLLKPMNEHGIAPDYVTALERDQIVADFFKDQPVQARTSLVASNLLLPESFENFKGNQFIYCPPLSYAGILGCDKLGNLDAGSSAGNLNLSLAVYLGFSKVIMVGHNLAFAHGTHESHVKGTIDRSREKQLSLDEIRKKASGGLVSTADGVSKVHTLLEYNLFRLQMERFIGWNLETEFINTAAKGAAIAGAVFQELPTAVKNLQNLAIKSRPQTLDSSLKAHGPQTEIRITKALDELNDFIFVLKQMKSESDEISLKLHQWKTEIEAAEAAHKDWNLRELDAKLEEVLRLKVKYVHENRTAESAFISVISAAHITFERCLNELPLKCKSNYELKKKFLLEHLKYFEIWKTWLPQVINEYEMSLSRETHSWTMSPASPVAT